MFFLRKSPVGFLIEVGKRSVDKVARGGVHWPTLGSNDEEW